MQFYDGTAHSGVAGVIPTADLRRTDGFWRGLFYYYYYRGVFFRSSREKENKRLHVVFFPVIFLCIDTNTVYVIPRCVGIQDDWPLPRATFRFTHYSEANMPFRLAGSRSS